MDPTRQVCQPNNQPLRNPAIKVGQPREPSRPISTTLTPSNHEPRRREGLPSGSPVTLSKRDCAFVSASPPRRSPSRACQAPDMPGIATITRWLREFPDFRDSYGFAKHMQVGLIFDRM